MNTFLLEEVKWVKSQNFLPLRYFGKQCNWQSILILRPKIGMNRIDGMVRYPFLVSSVGYQVQYPAQPDINQSFRPNPKTVYPTHPYSKLKGFCTVCV